MGHHSSKHHYSQKGIYSQTSSSKTLGSGTERSQPSNSVRHYDLSKFVVITVLFNPANYRVRYDLYKKFEAHMFNSGVHLITVECIFESTPRFGLPPQKFQVTQANNPAHIQLIAPSILWVKENLINIAIHHLPQHIEYIAWIDADIEFERLDWPHLTIAELQRYPIVQLFELSFFLGPGGKNDILRRDYSFGYSIRNNKIIDPRRYNEWYPHPGYAWAMRRSTFNTIGGLLDFCIIGSADLHFAFALLNRIQETIRPSLHQDYQRLAMKWGNRVAETAQNGAGVGYVSTNLWHYWHGERDKRNYIDRWLIIEKHQYSPLNHLEKNNDTGLLRLADKRTLGDPKLDAQMQALEHDIVAYFKSRSEDDLAIRKPAQPPPLVKKKPFAPAKTQVHRGGATKPRGFSSSRYQGVKVPPIWSSGPSGTHVDDHTSYLDHCNCPGHHHHPNDPNCPCSSHYIDDQHCWNTPDHDYDHHHHHDEHHHHPHDEHHHHPHDEHHHHPHDEHHHHFDDEHCHQSHHSDHFEQSNDHHHHHHNTGEHWGHDHSSHEHQHHGDWSNVDNTGYNYDNSSGATGYDYGGPGSFY